MSHVEIAFRPLEAKDAAEIVQWRYAAPYEVYNFPLDKVEDSVRYMAEPANGFYRMSLPELGLIGFCSFGKDGQVPGGDYAGEALDIGLGIRPDLTGQGQGSAYLQAVLKFAREAYHPARLRVTIAIFNRRAIRAWQKAGFRQAQAFRREGSAAEFVVLGREA